jgi:hypothetical protein
MPDPPKNGYRLLIPVALAAAVAIGGSYTLGFTHGHPEYVPQSDLTTIKVKLAEICVKLDVILDAHDISVSDDPTPTNPRSPFGQ